MSETYFVLGLGYGDEAKGSVADWFGRSTRAELNVRFASNSHSAHYVTRESGEVITFGQIGSAMCNSDLRCHIGHQSSLRPASLMVEIDHLATLGVDVIDRLTIDPNVHLVLPWHWMMERVGATLGMPMSCVPALDVRFGELFERGTLWDKLQRSYASALEATASMIRPSSKSSSKAIVDEFTAVQPLLRTRRDLETIAARLAGTPRMDAEVFQSCSRSPVILEGSQGVLLDPRFGFAPYVNPSDNSKRNALEFLSRVGRQGMLSTIGVTRAYSTRIGAGPFVTEDQELRARLPEAAHSISPSGREIRVGAFDMVATRYALRVSGGVSVIALNHLDRVGVLPAVPVCTSYRYMGRDFNLLERNFVVTTWRGRTLATDIREDCVPNEVTQLLMQMRPGTIERLSGWGTWKPETGDSSFPTALSNFVGLLEDSSGLDTKIGLLSFGPRRSDKFKLRPF